MATPKIITISDLDKNGKLAITRTDLDGANALQFEKRYEYLDDQGQPIAVLGGGRVTHIQAIADIPAGVLSAITTINNFMYNLALTQEGME